MNVRNLGLVDKDLMPVEILEHQERVQKGEVHMQYSSKNGKGKMCFVCLTCGIEWEYE